jgi:hypothetical protein
MSHQDAVATSSGRSLGRLLHVAVFAVLVGATCLLYSGALDLGYFHLDDDNYVINNPWIKAATAANALHIVTQPYFANYSPVHLFSYMLDQAIAGPDPRAFHLSSILWAGFAAGFVYLIGLALTGRWLPALAAGILFVAHPAHVEAVVWISSRKDLVAAAFGLPSILCYLLYRRRSGAQGLWYLLSVTFFILAVAGKLSVVVIPVILLLLDLFEEHRKRWWLAIVDKIPYVAVAVFFALMTMWAQPETRSQTTPYTAGASLLQNLWLLSGFGSYVLYRDRPDPNAGPLAYVLMMVVLFVAYVGPLLIRRRVPGYVTGLIYWVLLALIPSQVLGFLHPVTDRYLFFPSVAFCLLAGWGIAEAGRRWNKAALAGVVAAVIALAWTGKTLAYVGEWNDPRSVWYAAAKKSNESNVHLYLATHLQDTADYLMNGYPDNTQQQAKVNSLAGAMWKGEPRYTALTNEWGQGVKNGPVTRLFREDILTNAWTSLEMAVRKKDTILMPNLYYRRGKIAMERGDLELARKEFTRANEEAVRHTSLEVRQELAVRCAFAMGVVEWRARNYDAAAQLLKQADAQQKQFGRVWVPDIEVQLTRLEGLRARQSGQAPAVTPPAPAAAPAAPAATPPPAPTPTPPAPAVTPSPAPEATVPAPQPAPAAAGAPGNAAGQDSGAKTAEPAP